MGRARWIRDQQIILLLDVSKMTADYFILKMIKNSQLVIIITARRYYNRTLTT